MVLAEGAGGTPRGQPDQREHELGYRDRPPAPTRRSSINTIEHAAGAGLFVYDHGGGRFERNIIVGNALSGVVITAGGEVQLYRQHGRREHRARHAGRRGRARGARGQYGRGQRATASSSSTDTEVEQTGNELSGNAEPQLLDARAP